MFAFDFGSFVSDSKAKLAGLFVVLCAYRQFNCAVELKRPVPLFWEDLL